MKQSLDFEICASTKMDHQTILHKSCVFSILISGAEISVILIKKTEKSGFSYLS